MLRNLHVKNIALIDEIEVSFKEGLNILTGETGAGKSIILGAIMLALGGKTAKELLREGADSGLAELVFEISSASTKAALEAVGISTEEDTLIVSRRIYPNRVVNRINDETVTVAKLKEIAGILIDIHSQHEHQSLLKKANHLHILDRFGHAIIEEKKEQVQKEYAEYTEAKEKLEAMNLDEESRKRNMDFAAFEIQEITAADLQADEEEKLEQKYRKMRNGKQIMETLAQVYQYSGYEQTESAGNQLGQALSMLGRLIEYDEELQELEGQLATVDNLLNDFNRELSDYMESLNFDEREYRETEDRLDVIHKLEAKYGKTIPLVLQYLEEKKEEYANYEDYEMTRSSLEELCNKQLHSYQEAAQELSQLRKQTAEQLKGAITEALQDLNFLDVRFDMIFQPLDCPTRNGLDDAYFVISTNVGESMKPLWEVASGGELSRIMLAVKSCLAQEDAIDTLVFDEIDVGISGRTAQKVSERLSLLGREHQVICISHLPQIAAMADVHFKIEKQVINQKTITQIEQLSEQESIEEIARMLGGVEITDTVLNSAMEMKEMAARTKIY